MIMCDHMFAIEKEFSLVLLSNQGYNLFDILDDVIHDRSERTGFD